jgi:dTDP-4-dehydrorhamnose reductase
MKKTLILGAEGLLGTALVPVFNKKYEIVAWDRPDLDVTDRDEVLNKISKLKPDVIINATAFNAVDLAEKDDEARKAAQKINASGVGYLAEASEISGSVIIHFSSDYVFPGTSKAGYDENAKPSPVNIYGQTKLEGEQLLQKKAEKHYLIRLSRLFGPAGKSPMTKKSFIDSIIANAQKDPGPLKMVVDEFSCSTYSPDLAELVFRLVSEELPFGIYHGVNSGVSNWYDLAFEAFRLKGIKNELIEVKGAEFNRPAKRPEYSELINSKLPKQRSWKDALAEYLA